MSIEEKYLEESSTVDDVRRHTAAIIKGSVGERQLTLLYKGIKTDIISYEDFKGIIRNLIKYSTGNF